MPPMSYALATLLVLALQGAAWAGPVPAVETDAAPTPSTLAMQAPQGLADGLAAQAAASVASGSALAVEIIREAEASAAAAETPRSARRESSRAAASPAAPTPAAHNAAAANDDPWGLRVAGKATLQWVKDAIPWLRSDDDARESNHGAKLDTAEWSASPLEGGRAGRAGGLTLNPAPGSGDPLSTVGYGDGGQPKPAAHEQNLVREFIDMLRAVLEHPMTWLVVSLFVVGGLVVKKIDRRPTK
jgi:hypothetical protein